MYKRHITMLIIATTLMLAGCASDTNVLSESSKFTASANTKTENVARAIINACAAKGWKPSVAGPGRILALRRSSGHAAKVEISYTTDSFTIKYVDSDNMGYNGKEISSLYSEWVDELHDEIQKRLSRL